VKRSSLLIILIFSLATSFDRTSIRSRERKRSRREIVDSDKINTSFNQDHRFFSLAQVFSSSSSSFLSLDETRAHRYFLEIDKILAILDYMRSLHWTLKNFLAILHRNSRRHALRRSHEMLLDFIYLDFLWKKSFENQLDIQRINVMFRKTS
jgi:hypothetical protein